MAKKRKKTQLNQLSGFVIGIIGLTLYFLTIVWVKNECLITGKYLDRIRKEKISLENDRKLLTSHLANLTSNSRISRLAAERFVMVQPRPEPVIVVKDKTR
ncbi:MAG: hypothetical protein GXO91_03020 [FCB group bacterium]|nr:hypothetical protein [FCB group bacterium]